MVCSIYVTFSSLEEAKKIINELIKRKFIACANLIQSAESIYEWQGEIETSSEVVSFLKTTDSNFKKVSDYIKQNHSYKCPCVIKLMISDGNSDYLNWLKSSVRQ